MLFHTSIDFLGHHISAKGIEADKSKVKKILAWPTPQTATQAWSFLGLIRYIATFLPDLVTHAGILTELTTKVVEKNFPPWTPHHQTAFDTIKQIVVGHDCLTMIDFNLMPENNFF